MVDKWAGDGRYFLPARQVEPYRLWFEFLKLAHADPTIDVDYQHYADWGPFWEMEFSDWWSGARWRALFAVDVSVRLLDGTDADVADDQSILVRLPLGKDPKETIKDVKELLEQRGAGAKLGQMVQGRFALSEGYEKAFLKYLDTVNFLLRLYGIWLSHADLQDKGRTRVTAVEFYEWAKGRDDLIKGRGYRWKRPEFPNALRSLGQDILDGESTTGSDDLRQFKRHLQGAKSLAQNVAKGVFPGKW